MNKIRKTLKSLSETDKAYMAGIIDGEGAIYISRKTDPTMKRGYAYRLCVTVSNTDEPLIKWLNKITGLGSIKARKRNNLKHRQAYDWNLWSLQACQVLKATQSFLKQKRNRALLAIGFIEKQAGFKSHLTIKQYNAQKAVYDKFRILNKRGPK